MALMSGLNYPCSQSTGNDYLVVSHQNPADLPQLFEDLTICYQSCAFRASVATDARNQFTD
jgi:hypothetical protein